MISRLLIPLLLGAALHPAAGNASGNSAPPPGQGETRARALPPLILEELGGGQRRLSDWQGRVIILNFWASWCAPCQAEIPHLIRYQRTYAGRGLQVVGVGLDEERRLRNVVRTFGIDYPVLLAGAGDGSELLEQWGNPRRVLPFTVVIDRDGQIQLLQAGILDEESFADYVLPLLDAVAEGADRGGPDPG